MPVFVAAAGGGVLLDVDGNSLIDLGSGIAVTSVGNAAPAVVAAVQTQVEQFIHTCFMVTPYESYLGVCEELARVTPGEHEKRPKRCPINTASGPSRRRFTASRCPIRCGIRLA
jgi:4-aminobutyrate aminotransferase/(S)-3-amino-2-methylpropionate transaminase